MMILRKHGRAALTTGLLSAVMILTGCAKDGDGDMMYDAPSKNVTPKYIGEFDGEWTAGQDNVGTARLVVTEEEMTVTLPAPYIAYLMAENQGTDDLWLTSSDGRVRSLKMDNIEGGEVTMTYKEQGYSNTAQYFTIEGYRRSDSNKSRGVMPIYWIILVQDTIHAKGYAEYHVGVDATQGATAVYDNSIGQWTLALPIEALVATDLLTQQTTVTSLASPITLYFNTGRRRW